MDEEALFTCLQTRHLEGAALDVFEKEPYTGPLTQIETCFLTPHIGSMTQEVRALMERQVVEDVIGFFDNKPLKRPFPGFDFGGGQA